MSKHWDQDGERRRKQRHLKPNRKYKNKKGKKEVEEKFVKLDPTTDTEWNLLVKKNNNNTGGKAL